MAALQTWSELSWVKKYPLLEDFLVQVSSSIWFRKQPMWLHQHKYYSYALQLRGWNEWLCYRRERNCTTGLYKELPKLLSLAREYLKYLSTGTNFWLYTSSNAVDVLWAVCINRICYRNAATSLQESINFIVVMTTISQENKTGRKPHTTASQGWNYKTVIIKTFLFLCKLSLYF